MHKKVLIRLPNWLGDIMMSLPTLRAMAMVFPESEYYLVVKKEYAGLLPVFNIPGKVIPFDKSEYKGLRGQIRFGRMLKKNYRPDLFISLPDSLSSALIGYFSGAQERIGYQGQWRSLLLSHAWRKPTGIHRSREYLHLLEKYSQKKLNLQHYLPALKQHPLTPGKHKLLLNINSEASSRRMPTDFATRLLSALIQTNRYEIYLSGGPRDIAHVASLPQALLTHPGVHNIAGKTNLSELFSLISEMDISLSTDSGIAHVCNALNTRMVVLFGAGDEHNTGPVRQEIARVLRLDGLHCAPCLSNTCRYNDPVCIRNLSIELILNTLTELEHV